MEAEHKIKQVFVKNRCLYTSKCYYITYQRLLGNLQATRTIFCSPFQRAYVCCPKQGTKVVPEHTFPRTQRLLNVVHCSLLRLHYIPWQYA